MNTYCVSVHVIFVVGVDILSIDDGDIKISVAANCDDAVLSYPSGPVTLTS